nr:solute carrier family 13 member 2-like isoform X1 [Dermacentor andersoni]
MVRQAWCKMPWGIIIVLGAVQVATRVVEEYDLLPQLFKLFKPTFWTARSHIEVQAILATISSMLAETTNNRTLSLLMMPIVQDIAESKNMYPMYYAIPVVVGASSNVIMPISIPMVVMHDIGRVPFVRLVRTNPAQLALMRMYVGLSLREHNIPLYSANGISDDLLAKSMLRLQATVIRAPCPPTFCPSFDEI